MLSIQDIINKRNEIIASGIPTEEVLSQFLNWLVSNEAQLSPEGLAYFDKILKSFSIVAKENIERMVESPEKRKHLRSAASVGGNHFKAENLLKGLEREPAEQDEALKEWSRAMLNIHQTILDLLFDVTSEGGGKKQSIVFVGICYACVDELTAALHLGRHHYYAQAANHLRTVLESLDRLELFAKSSEWIDVWAGNDKKKIRRELSPAEVREKLGKDRFDPLYGFLSEHGTHPTFEMFRNRAMRDGKDAGVARVFVAGTPFEHSRMLHYSISFVVGNLAISKVIGLFLDAHNKDECISFMTERAKEAKAYIEKHFVPWAKDMGLDISELLTVFDQLLSEDGLKEQA